MPGIWSANKSKQRQRNNLLHRHYIAPSLFINITTNNLSMFSGNDSFAWLVQKIFLKHVFWYTKLCLFVDYLIFAAAVACSLPLLETHWEPIVFSISVTCYILYIVLSVSTYFIIIIEHKQRTRCSLGGTANLSFKKLFLWVLDRTQAQLQFWQ